MLKFQTGLSILYYMRRVNLLLKKNQKKVNFFLKFQNNLSILYNKKGDEMSKPSRRKSRKHRVRKERLRIEKHRKKMKKSSKVSEESVDNNKEGQVKVTSPDNNQ